MNYFRYFTPMMRPPVSSNASPSMGAKPMKVAAKVALLKKESPAVAISFVLKNARDACPAGASVRAPIAAAAGAGGFGHSRAQCPNCRRRAHLVRNLICSMDTRCILPLPLPLPSSKPVARSRGTCASRGCPAGPSCSCRVAVRGIRPRQHSGHVLFVEDLVQLSAVHVEDVHDLLGVLERDHRLAGRAVEVRADGHVQCGDQVRVRGVQVEDVALQLCVAGRFIRRAAETDVRAAGARCAGSRSAAETDFPVRAV